jgi:predicted lipoprotein with Yx(FWY)xxD motif
MHMTRTRLAAVGSIGAVALVAAGCGSSSSSSSSSKTATPKPHAAAGSALAAKTSPMGKILTAKGGRTLYLFAKDTGPKSMCSGACASNWPPFTASTAPKVSGGASSTQVKLVRRSDGTMQVTYNGHPLYFYSGDTSAGQTTGQGLNAFGARWYTVSPAGVKVTAKAKSSGGGGSSSSSGGGGGGGSYGY